MKKRLLAIIAAAAMVVTMIPSMVFAVVEDTDVASIGDTGYDTLQSALDAAQNGDTVKLLKDASGSFDVEANKAIIIDLGGNTMTLEPAIGSSGTETNGTRVLYGGELKVVNGELVCGVLENTHGSVVKIGIANYGKLTLENVYFEADSNTNVLYTINNRGELTLKGETTVETGGATNGLAITNDPYNYYEAQDAVLNIADDKVSVGKVQIERYVAGRGGVKLNISGGTIEGLYEDGNSATQVEGNVTGGDFGNDVSDYVKDGHALRAEGRSTEDGGMEFHYWPKPESEAKDGATGYYDGIYYTWLYDMVDMADVAEIDLEQYRIGYNFWYNLVDHKTNAIDNNGWDDIDEDSWFAISKKENGNTKVKDAVGVGNSLLKLEDTSEYKFVGWYTAETDENWTKVVSYGEEVTVDTVVTDDMKVFAKWERIETVAKLEASPDTGDNNMAPFAVAGLVLAAMAAVAATRRRTN